MWLCRLAFIFKQSLNLKITAVPVFSCKGQPTNLAVQQNNTSESNMHPLSYLGK